MVFLKQVHDLPLALRNLPIFRIAIHFKPWLGDHLIQDFLRKILSFLII